jgi:dihydropyrimidinase
MDAIVKGGKIVTAYEKYKADIGIKDGKIVAIGHDLQSANGTEVIDASGKLVMPGMIDAHVHLSLPFGGTVSADTWQTGTRAAAAGGITTVLDFAIQKPGDTLKETIRKRKEEADGDVFVDYGLHGGIAKWSDDLKAEIGPMCQEGITSFKMFMIYRNEGWLSTDPMIIEALEEAKKHGGMLQVHAESVDLIDSMHEAHSSKEEMDQHGAYLHTMTRPNATEYEAIQRAITWSEYTGGHLYVVHMSTKEGVEMVREARKKGINVVGETCPQYLLLDDSKFKGENGHFYATCPQLKKPEDSVGLWKGLDDESLSVVGTDTCTFNSEQKALWEGDYKKIPMGMPGSELMLPLLYNDGVREGKISLHRMVEIASTNPAKVFGMYPNKGSLTIGADADIVIFDKEKEVTVDYQNMETNCDWSPYQGKKLKGYPHMTLLRGKVVAKEGKCVGEQGYGQFIKRNSSGNYVK